MSNKPEVKYDTKKDHLIRVGSPAVIWPLDHPNPHGLVSNTKFVSTSVVLRHCRKTGNFETSNTCYVPSTDE